MKGIELKKAKEELEFVIDKFYDFPEEAGVSNSINNIQNAIKAIEELEEYYAIGTVEECRKAVEKQKAKKPTYEGDGYADGELVYDTWICPNCGEYYETDYDDYIYCPNCGQAIDLSEVN